MRWNFFLLSSIRFIFFVRLGAFFENARLRRLYTLIRLMLVLSLSLLLV